MKLRLKLAVTLVALAAVCSPLAAEQIIMRNGQVYNGRIVNQTRTEVIFDTPAGRVVLRKADIRRINYGPTPDDKAREEAQKREEEKKRAEDKKKEEEKARELKKQEEAKEAERKREADRQAELKKQQEAKKQEDLKKTDEQKKREEAQKLEEAKKQQDASRNAEEMRRQEELKKAQELQRQEEGKRLSEEELRQRIRDEVKRELEAAEARRRAEEARLREEAKKPKVTRGGAFARSFFLPGWGQVYQGRRVGFFYGAAFLGLAGASLHQDSIYKARQSNYEDSARNFLLITPFMSRLVGYAQDDAQAASIFFLGIDHNERAFAGFQKAAQRAKLARGALIGLYAWNLVDVLLFHKDQTSVGFSSGPDSVQLSFQYRF